MKGYVERNLRKNEQVVAKCHVTWTAFVPIVIRTILLIFGAWAIAELVVEIIVDFRYTGIPEEGQISYFGSDEWGMISGAATIFFIAVIVISLVSAAISILKLVCIELVVTEKKIIGKTGVIYSNAIDAYLEKVEELLPEDMTLDEDLITWIEPLDNRNLECVVQVLPPEESQRVRWISHKLIVDEPEDDWEW